MTFEASFEDLMTFEKIFLVYENF